MIYLVTFGIFVVFVLCLALGMLCKRGGLKSESEAHALLEGINCAACANTSCGFNGNSHHKPSKKCLSETEINFKQV